MRVDDKLHSHRKTRSATRSHPTKRRDAGAMGLWALAGSWSAQNGTDGWVPEEELDRWDDDWQALVARLVDAGFWFAQENDGEPGYAFHGWLDLNPSANASSASGIYGNHVRWHVEKGVVNPGCEHCPRDPEPQSVPDIGGESGGDRVANRDATRKSSHSPTQAQPIPNPKKPSSPTSDDEGGREDVERVCEHMLTSVRARGAKRAKVTAAWRKSARLMIDSDGYTPEQITWLIDRVAADDFWASNVMSMPKLREQSDRLLVKFRPTPTARTYPDARTLETPPDDLTDEEYAQWHRERVAR